MKNRLKNLDAKFMIKKEEISVSRSTNLGKVGWWGFRPVTQISIEQLCEQEWIYDFAMINAD